MKLHINSFDIGTDGFSKRQYKGIQWKVSIQPWFFNVCMYYNRNSTKRLRSYFLIAPFCINNYQTFNNLPRLYSTEYSWTQVELIPALAFTLNTGCTKRCDTIRSALFWGKPPVVTRMTVRVQHSVGRWDMRPGAFVVPFKETTRGGRSRAIRLHRDQPLSYRATTVMPLIYCGSLLTSKPNPEISRK